MQINVSSAPGRDSAAYAKVRSRNSTEPRVKARRHRRFNDLVTRRNRRIQNFKRPGSAPPCLLVLIDNVADGHERPCQHRQVAVEGDEFSEGHRALQYLAASQPEHDGRPDSRPALASTARRFPRAWSSHMVLCR